ncbi:MAG TPA: GNAT family N-acetyltransferase [Pyrinomonadaceae bacterium]|nr:GNAT family N-acetyltransferase [Pyrinomonadaceae bacterium]
MLNQNIATRTERPLGRRPFLTTAPDLANVIPLREEDRDEMLGFLNFRPVHTVVMTSFIQDNGVESELNRGKFYGYYNCSGRLEGIALIGHTTLVEARSEKALKALAFKARTSETPINLIMSSGQEAEEFWSFYTDGIREPRLTCTELLFELHFPFLVPDCDREIREASLDELEQVAEAQAAIAFMESGIDPMARDREGFLKRCARRIEQGRTYVVVENGKLIFKADIVAETSETVYLEGVYVAPEFRGQGIGSGCLAELTLDILKRVPNVCMLSNINFIEAHLSYIRAGFRNTDFCTTLFV